VEPVVVASGRRRAGVGIALVKHVIGQARGLGVRYLGVRPVARNAEAISFFYEAGFHTLGQIELFIDLDEAVPAPWLPGPELAGRRFRH
jgi:GNAT superfamily N-acetyltransferase